MAINLINIGTAPNDGTGDSARVGGGKINAMFTEVYDLIEELQDVASITNDYNSLSNLPTLGTAAALNVGTAANNVVQLNASAQLPAVDGSLLTGIVGGGAGDVTVSGTPTATQIARWTDADTIEGVSSISTSQITGLGTAAALDVGTTALKVVQLNASGQLPAVDGSLLTGVAGAGDVTGAASSVADRIVQFDGTSGKLLKDGGLSASSFATAAQGATADTAVQPARTISAGSGLTGGGDLSANRTLALSGASIASLALADTALQTADLSDFVFSPSTPSAAGEILLSAGSSDNEGTWTAGIPLEISSLADLWAAEDNVTFINPLKLSEATIAVDLAHASGAVAFDGTDGFVQKTTATQALTLNSPSNILPGVVYEWHVLRSGGAWGITMDAAFNLTDTWPAATTAADTNWSFIFFKNIGTLASPILIAWWGGSTDL